MSATRRALGVRSWLLLSHGFVLALPVLVLVASGALLHDLREQTRVDLRNQAVLISLFAGATLDLAHDHDPQATLAGLGPRLTPRLVAAKQTTLAGVRVVDADGVVVATSGDELGEDLSDREEVAEALEGAVGETLRPRPPLSQRQPLSSASRHAKVRLFVAAPVTSSGDVIGAVVLSRTPREESQALYQMVPAWAALGALGITAAVAWLIANGSRRPLRDLAAIADRIGGGEIAALESLGRPQSSRIREVAELADAIAAMARRLQERLAYISEFASNVSHEFKTPLSTLHGTVELLRDDPDMPAAQRARFLDNATAEIDRLTRLVGGLLALARAEERGERAAMSIVTVAREVAGRHPGVTVEGPDANTLGDRAQIETALGNLVGNARRYGGSSARIVVRTVADGATVGWEVEDDGPGISSANLPRVFERFFTTHRAGGGTGLGLSIVRAVAAAHGGAVSVASEPGKTVFRLSLPSRPGGRG